MQNSRREQERTGKREIKVFSFLFIFAKPAVSRASLRDSLNPVRAKKLGLRKTLLVKCCSCDLHIRRSSVFCLNSVNLASLLSHAHFYDLKSIQLLIQPNALPNKCKKHTSHVGVRTFISLIKIYTSISRKKAAKCSQNRDKL